MEKSINKYTDLVFGNLKNYEKNIKKDIIKYLKCYCGTINCKRTEYHTMIDNGGKPFETTHSHSDGKVCVYKLDEDSDSDDEESYDENNLTYTKILEYKCERYLVGQDYTEGEYGNSVLLDMGDNRYIYIGSDIYEFQTEDKILNYYSNMGNSRVPYPIALGEKNVYFMLDNQYINKNEFKNNLTMTDEDWADCYGDYYGHTGDLDKSKYQNMKDVKKIQPYRSILFNKNITF